jgi:hypothetical protein
MLKADYNLADTAVMLDSLSKMSVKYCPSLEIVSSESDGIRIVASRPVWTGRPALTAELDRLKRSQIEPADLGYGLVEYLAGNKHFFQTWSMKSGS